MARIVRVGAPQALEIAGMWLIHAFGIRVIAGLKDEGALGAHILAIRVESMSFLPGFAIATAAAALAGQYLGAGSRELAVRAVRLCWKSAVVLMSMMGVFFVFGRHLLIGWMAPGSELHLAACRALAGGLRPGPAVFRHLHHPENLDARGGRHRHRDALVVRQHVFLSCVGAVAVVPLRKSHAHRRVDRLLTGSRDPGGDFHPPAFPRQMAGRPGLIATGMCADPAMRG